MLPLPALLALLLPLAEVNRLWYSLPLLVSISLAYAATRHEHMIPIVRHAAWFGMWIVIVMGGVAVLLQLMVAQIS